MIGSEIEIKPFWRMGKVVQVIPGADGKVRSAKLMRSDRSEGIYPICKLYPLELSLTSTPKVTPDEIEERSLVRPERKAAKKCKDALKRMCN